MKKRIIVLMLGLSLLIGQSYCYAETDFDSVVPEDLSNEELVDAYNELRDSYNALYKLYLKESGTANSAETESKSETAGDEITGSLVTVNLANKTTSKGKYDSDYYVDFVFEVRNEYDKDIRGIQGNATFKDLFGEKIISMGLVSDLYFDCNQFIDNHMKLYSTDFADLQFEYKPTMIVFNDGTSIEFE